MSKQNIVFEEVMEILQKNGVNFQEFITFLSHQTVCTNGVKFRFSDGAQSTLLLPNKTVNGLMVNNLWLGCFMSEEAYDWDKADYQRRNYSFTHPVYDPEKVYTRLADIDEAQTIYEHLAAVNTGLRLLGQPLIYGRYWLHRPVMEEQSVMNFDSGQTEPAKPGEKYKILIIID